MVPEVILNSVIGKVIGYVIDFLVNHVPWVRNRLTKKNEENNEELAGKLEKRIKELVRKNKLASDLIEIKEELHNQEKNHIFNSIKRNRISLNRLVKRIKRPLKVILISYADQEISGFIKKELKKYHVESLGSTVSIIPPAHVPPDIHNEKDLQSWFEEKILRGRQCKLKFLILLNIKENLFWKNYIIPQKEGGKRKQTFHKTLGEALNIDNIFKKDEINAISFGQFIKDGDIAWFASLILTKKELKRIIENQDYIENELDSPNLQELASDDMKPRISSVLSTFFDNSKEIGDSIVEEAKYWNRELN